MLESETISHCKEEEQEDWRSLDISVYTTYLDRHTTPLSAVLLTFTNKEVCPCLSLLPTRPCDNRACTSVQVYPRTRDIKHFSIHDD